MKRRIFSLLVAMFLLSCAAAYAVPAPQTGCSNVYCDLVICANGQYGYLAVVYVGYDSNIGKGRCPQTCFQWHCLQAANANFYFVDHQGAVYEVKNIHSATERARIRDAFMKHKDESTDDLIALGETVLQGDEAFRTMTVQAYRDMTQEYNAEVVKNGGCPTKQAGALGGK